MFLYMFLHQLFSDSDFSIKTALLSESIYFRYSECNFALLCLIIKNMHIVYIKLKSCKHTIVILRLRLFYDGIRNQTVFSS